MNKLTYIESGLRTLLDPAQLEHAQKAMARRYAPYLSGRNVGARDVALRALVSQSGFHSHLDAASSPTSEEFRIEAGYTPAQVQLRITLARVDGTWGYPVETVVCDDSEGPFTDRDIERPLKLLNVLLDFQDAYWAEYFSSGRETFVTVDWSSHSYAGTTIFVRGFERAWALEQAADRLFAEHGSGDHDIVPVSSET